VKRPPSAWVGAWDSWCAQLTAETLALAGSCVDASKTAARLAERADHQRVDRFSALAAVRWRLAGLLDHEPDSLVPLVAMGLVGLAAMEPSPEVEVRAEIISTMAGRNRDGGRDGRRLNGRPRNNGDDED
jgi:hypothetical protein